VSSVTTDPNAAASKTVRITGGTVVGFDSQRQGHEILDGAEVVFAGDRIIHVGGRYAGRVDEEVDATGYLVMPGLVDAHALMDIGIHLLLWDRERDEGYRPRWYVEGNEYAFTPAQVEAGAEAMMTMLLRSGVTTFLGVNAMVFKRWHDEPWEPPLYAGVANKLGLRAYLSHHFRSSVPIVGDPVDDELVDEHRGFEGLEHNIEFVRASQRGDFGPRVHGLLFPYTQDTVSNELLRATRQAADELGVGWRMHFAQSPGELEVTLARTGRTPIERLADLGVLGPDVLLTHCLYGRGHAGGPWVSDAELDLLAQGHVTVGHTPWIYLFGGRTLHSLGRYLAAGVGVALGTDTYPGDMLQEMRVAAQLGKVGAVADGATTPAASVSATARTAFDAATLGAARFLGRDDLGRLAVGAKADIVLVRTDTASFAPTLDPIRSLVYYASFRDVSDVWVDGRRVMTDGRIPGFEESETNAKMGSLLHDVADVLERWDVHERPTAKRWESHYPRRRVT
jgi:cytosine/adenosine deaminase-related metal-dependent hydrolase